MIFSTQSILQAYFLCRKNKRTGLQSLNFELYYEDLLYDLSSKLKERKYKIGKSSCFVISYPTVREIFAANFIDRIVHHLLIMYIQDEIDKRFIYDSLACRKNKGGTFGIHRLKGFLNKSTYNGSRNAYYLKLDIKNFFYSINKEILLNLLTKEIKKLPLNIEDIDDLLWVSEEIINHNPCSNFKFKGDPSLLKNLPYGKSLFTAPSDTGLPIGNLTSQFFANLYLNEVDQFIKRELKVKYYLRYADDMLFISSSMKELKNIERNVDNFLLEKLKLHLKKEKTVYGSTYQGIDFIGYIVSPGYTLARNRTIGNLKKKLYYFNNGLLIDRKFCMEEAIPIHNPPTKEEVKSICASINSTFGHLKWCDSYNLRKNLYESHFGKLKNYLKPVNSFKFFRPIKPSS